MADPLDWLKITLAFAEKNNACVGAGMYRRAIRTAIGLKRARDSWHRRYAAQAVLGPRCDDCVTECERLRASLQVETERRESAEKILDAYEEQWKCAPEDIFFVNRDASVAYEQHRARFGGGK